MATAAAALVKVEREGPVTIATLSRPEALNALSRALMERIEELLDNYEGDPAQRCLVLCGSARVFSTGADIKEMDGATEAAMRGDRHLTRWDRVGRCPKPVIAAVSGFALGGGCELALACDLIVASETAVFGQPEIMIGVIPGAGGTVRLARCAGKAFTLEAVLTGRRISAREALAAGMVNRVVPVESYLDEAKKLARDIASQPPLAVQAAKAAVMKSYEAPLSEALSFERDRFWRLFSTKDQKEGMKAFIQKREPKWQGV